MEFKAVSMPCTKAQWEEIRRELYFFGIQNEDITDFETDRFLVNNYMSVNNLVTNIPPSDMFKHGRMFFPTYNKKAFLEACGVDYQNALKPKIAEKKFIDNEVFHLSKEQIYALNNGTTTVKELFPDLFTKIEVGKWYENILGSVFCPTKIGVSMDFVEGFGFSEDIEYYEETTLATKESKPAAIEKIESLFKTEIKKRYKEGMWIKQPWNDNYVCKINHEALSFDKPLTFMYAFLDNTTVFYKGQFAEIPTISKQEAENQLKINIE